MNTNAIYNEDCIAGMSRIPDKQIDLILCDLPQEITSNEWDKKLPLPELWDQYNRVIKDDGAIVLFSNGMMTAELMVSNPKMWRYNLVWEKTNPTGFLNAKRMPLRAHEDICVFYKKPPTYNPQKTTGHKPVHRYTKHKGDGTNYGATRTGLSGGGSTERYPRSVIQFPSDKQKNNLHPTQKPVALLEWLIRTYTNPGEIVLDSCMGSGSTIIAAINTNRQYIGFETDPVIFQKAEEWIYNGSR